MGINGNTRNRSIGREDVRAVDWSPSSFSSLNTRANPGPIPVGPGRRKEVARAHADSERTDKSGFVLSDVD